MINAEFKANGETINGAPLFELVGKLRIGLWMGKDGNWWLGAMKFKGQNRGTAYLGNKVNPLAQHAVWQVFVGSGFEDQPLIKCIQT